MNNTSKIECQKPVEYKKPAVLAATKNNKNFSAACMGGNCCCLHCRQF